MKSSFGKIGRKLTMQKEMRDHQPSVPLDELDQASKDMQDMRNCYDGLLSAAAATANSIYEFSEALNEMGNCLLGKTAPACDAESGNVLSILGNLQLELEKIADTYRSSVIVTITNPAESLLSELVKVEEMKFQCFEKREVYDHMVAQHREKGKPKSGKLESSITQKLQEAQDEYDDVARLCVFRAKSLKEGQWRSLLTQAARHHTAQLNFFRKGLKAVELVEPFIRNVAEKYRIDCRLSGSHEGELMSGYEGNCDGELSYDYKLKKQGLDDATSPNPMEVDEVDVQFSQASNLEDFEINQDRHKTEHLFNRQTRVSSYSAPLYPDKINPSEKLKDPQPGPKSYSYVLPPPIIDTRNPISKPAPLTAPLTTKTQSTINTGNLTPPSIQLPTPTNYYNPDSYKIDRQQSYSGPLPPIKQYSFKYPSNSSGPITSTDLPSRASISKPSLSSNTSPKISELHELPRPPSKPVAISGGLNLNRHSAPLMVKNKDVSPPNKRAMLTSSCASPLPLPPSVVKFNPTNSGT